MTLSRLPWTRVLPAALLVAVSAVWAAPVLAQGADTGALSVRVADPDGAPLPGVMILVQGPLGTRTGYTGVDGTFRFPGLYPGDYSATFSLDGFKTVVRENLRISFARTTSVAVEMELSSVQETITVTGESPVVDVKSTNVGRLYTDELIDKAPTASGLWAGVMDHVPGVVVGGIDVGGGSSGQQDGFSAYGSVGGQNVYNINGANTTDPDALGASSFYYSIGAFEEVGVSTASHDIEVQTPGVVLNMVTKSGSNDWHGAARFFWEDDSFVSNNVDAELEAAGVGEGNPNDKLTDLNVQGGGPIVRNRAWFFADYWDFQVNVKVLGLEEIDDTSLENWTLSGTVQLDDDHKVSVRYLTDRKYRGNRGASRNNPFLGRIQDSFVDIPQLQWQGVLSQNTFADVRFSKMDMEFPLEARDPDSSNPLPGFQDRPAVYDLGEDSYIDVPGWPTLEIFYQRDNTALSGNVSHYLTRTSQSHDFKFGGEYQETQSFSPERRPFGQLPMTSFGVSERVRLYNTSLLDVFDVEEPNAELVAGTNWSIYAQDTMTFRNRLTITAGVRYDWRKTYNPQQNRLDSFWAGLLDERFSAESIEAIDPVVSFNDVVPRFGVIFDLKGDGQTALKANYSQYSQQLGVTLASRVNRNSTGYQEYFWNDLNGDLIFQWGEQLNLRRESFPGITVDFDPDLTSPITHEVTGGVEHELMDNFLVSATGIWRDTRNMNNDVNIGIPYGPHAAMLGVPDPYRPVQVQDPGPDGVFGTADDGGFLTIYAQDPATFGQSFDFYTDPSKFGFPQQTRTYRGVSFVAHKRWSNNWQVLASWDIGETKFAGDFGDNPNRDFDNREQLSTADRLHNIKVTANYLIAEPIGVNVGVFLRSMSGQAVNRTFSYSGSFRSEANGGFPSQGTLSNVDVAARGADTIGPKREDHVNIVDLRMEKQVTIGRFGVLHAYGDIFNLFNANTVTSFRTVSGSRWGEINNIIPPRVFRLGAAWDF